MPGIWLVLGDHVHPSIEVPVSLASVSPRVAQHLDHPADLEALADDDASGNGAQARVDVGSVTGR